MNEWMDGKHQSRRLFVLSTLGRLLETLWPVAHQAPLSMGFPRQECWSGLPFFSIGYLLNPRIETMSPSLAGKFFTTEPPGKFPSVLFITAQT